VFDAQQLVSGGGWLWHRSPRTRSSCS